MNQKHELETCHKKREDILVELQKKSVIYEGNHRGYRQLMDMLGYSDSEDKEEIDSSDISILDEEYGEEEAAETCTIQSYSTRAKFATTRQSGIGT